jgi:hypothetical protein
MGEYDDYCARKHMEAEDPRKEGVDVKKHERLSRIEARFERLVVAGLRGPTPLRPQDYWEMAVEVETFLEGKR